MFHTFKKTIEQYQLIKRHETILIALSGGVDSMVLLFLLRQFKIDQAIKLCAVHINHNLRSESISDQRFVENICKEQNIELKVFSYPVLEFAKQHDLSLEEAGRIKRKKAYKEAKLEFSADKIALAHHLNDRMETFFLNVFRGSGLTGLSAMPAKSKDLIRPLIYIGKKEIMQYAKEQAIPFREDQTNRENIFFRNRIRNELIPLLQKDYSPSLEKHMKKTFVLLEQEELYLDKQAELFYRSIAKESDQISQLDIPFLLNLDISMQQRIIRKQLFALCQLRNISEQHVSDIISLLYGQSGKKLTLPHSILVKRAFDQLLFQQNEEVVDDYCYRIEEDISTYMEEIDQSIFLSRKNKNKWSNKQNICTYPIDYDKINGIILARNKIDGDRIALAPCGHKKIQDIFTDKKIPQYKRNEYPIVCDETQLIALMRLRLSKEFYVQNETKQIGYLTIWRGR